MTTVRELLFGAAADEARAVTGVASALPVQEVPPETAARAVLARVAGLLEFEVTDVLVQAWRARSALADAARLTLAEPGTVRRINLAVYAIPWEYEMEFDLRLAGKALTTVTVSVGLDLEVTALTASVQRGRLVSVDGGQYNVAATLAVQGIPVLAKERVFALAYEMKVGSGIPLTDGAAASV
ncbi:hypothetical protein [Catelliglobosispora koreensis]|uniref:hypothetical protein n=1 Tax=Catelliglobosispora koreensis TaxID=129052 RepID=UPI0003727142|nr:hypothetical protein [Catelliglobosispora koreensis]